MPFDDNPLYVQVGDTLRYYNVVSGWRVCIATKIEGRYVWGYWFDEGDESTKRKTPSKMILTEKTLQVVKRNSTLKIENLWE